MKESVILILEGYLSNLFYIHLVISNLYKRKKFNGPVLKHGPRSLA